MIHIGSSVTKKKKKKYKKIISGMRQSNLKKISLQRYIRCLNSYFKNRKIRRRLIRSSWIIGLKKYLRFFNISYSFFVFILKQQKIILDRKLIFRLVSQEFYPLM